VQIAFLHRFLPNTGQSRNGALSLFIDFLVNPLAGKLSGPCTHCDSYFINETARLRVYCSRECSSAATSRHTHAERRAQLEAQNLRDAARSIKAFEKARTQKGWKKWVSDDTGISQNWLTRAVKANKLVAPPEGRRLMKTPLLTPGFRRRR
jgi:hypothetical protein